MDRKKQNSLVPWECVILAVDPGKISGVSIYNGGALRDSGIDMASYLDETEEVRDIDSWVWSAYSDAESQDIPLVAVIESHVMHGKWSAQAMAGTAESVGVWKYCIAQLPKLRWKPKVLRVPVDEWRKGIYGHCRSKVAHFRKNDRSVEYDGRDYWKKMARHAAGVEDDNEAEAILIGRYATQWWKVGEQAGVTVPSRAAIYSNGVFVSGR